MKIRQVGAELLHAYGRTDRQTETKGRLLYLKTQFVPRSKHFSSRL